MPSLANSDGEVDGTLALRLSKLSPDEFDEQLAQFRPEGSQLSSDDVDEQVTQLHCMESALATEKARSSAPPNESDEGDLELALEVPQRPADIFDNQVNELGRRTGPHAALEGSLASLPTATSLVRGQQLYI